jgi:hypothetical protein
MRLWWSVYRCDTSKYVRVSFPGDGRTWNLWVADKSAPIWEAVADIMASTPYLFRETAGGTYNCRPPSLHAYGLALDLNPSKNPFQYPVEHEYPLEFIARMEGIRANGKQALMWGGRFPASNPPDTMHWQINVAPSDCKNVTYPPKETEADMYAPCKQGDRGSHVEAWQRVFNRISGFKPKQWTVFEADTTTELQKYAGGASSIGPAEGAAIFAALGKTDAGGLTEAQVKALINDTQVVARLEA